MATNTQIPTIELNNGVQIPQIGLGVWQAEEGSEVESAVETAIETGYRLIDTAAIYGNERGVGNAIKNSGVARDELFITTKLWNAHHEYDAALQAFEESLKKLQLDYVDLYLIHWPLPMDNLFPEAWRALEKLLADKRARAIGVSNFLPHHLEKLAETQKVVPAVNQIELHPLLQSHATREYCKAHNIAIESYSPLMRGGDSLENDTLQKLAQAHDKTTAQIVLRWHLQSGFIVIPKSVTPSRIRENFDVFGFELSADDMAQIAAMNQDDRIGADPETAAFK